MLDKCRTQQVESTASIVRGEAGETENSAGYRVPEARLLAITSHSERAALEDGFISRWQSLGQPFKARPFIQQYRRETPYKSKYILLFKLKSKSGLLIKCYIFRNVPHIQICV